jgi:hypothetical protein
MNNVIDRVALNPQPIPPGILFYYDVARSIIDRAWLLYEVQVGLGKVRDNDGDWLPVTYLRGFDRGLTADAIARVLHPPHPNWRQEPRAVDVLVVSAELRTAADATDVPVMQDAFRATAERLQRAALQRAAE